MDEKILFEITIPRTGTELVFASDVASAMAVAEALIVPEGESYSVEELPPRRAAKLLGAWS